METKPLSLVRKRLRTHRQVLEKRMSHLMKRDLGSYDRAEASALGTAIDLFTKEIDLISAKIDALRMAAATEAK